MTYELLDRNAMLSEIESKGIRSIVVGVSGGADSVALLHNLLPLGVELQAVHCNFHLRGEESNRDMDFVSDLCAGLGVPLQIVHFDVEGYRAEHGGSVEMVCRRLRYDKFRELMEACGAQRIAVAHNADDQAETLLLNLMRGGGVAGLRAMKRDTGIILRPLLHTPRADIEKYLAARGLTYITDSTNLSSDYCRNFLRNEILPALESRWPEAKESLCRTASIMEQEERMLRWAEKQLIGSDLDVLRLDSLLASPDPEWLLRRFVLNHSLPESIVPEMMRSIRSGAFQSGKQWKGKSGLITLERDSLEFFDTAVPAKFEYHVIARENDADLQEYVSKAPLAELWTPLPPERLEFRFAQMGDRIKPLGIKGSTSVSKIMKDAKLSFAAKRRTVVAADRENGEIIWVVGLRRSRVRMVTPGDKTVYCYTVRVK